MTQEPALKVTQDQLDKLAHLLGPVEAREAVADLIEKHLGPASVQLLRSFLARPMLRALSEGKLEKTLRAFRLSSRRVQALALVGLHSDIEQRISRVEHPYSSRQLAPTDAAEDGGLADDLPIPLLIELRKRADQLWASEEAHRRAVTLLQALQFPIRQLDLQTHQQIAFGYSAQDEVEWANLLATIGDESQQQRVVETLKVILADPEMIAPSYRRADDGLPDLTSILHHILAIQSGEPTSQGLTHSKDNASIAARHIDVISSRNLAEMTSAEIIEMANNYAFKNALNQVGEPSAPAALRSALDVILWRTERILQLTDYQKKNELTSIAPTALRPNDSPSPAPTLESIQDQILAYLRACGTPEQLAEAARAFQEKTLGKEWARRAAEAGTLKEAQRVLEAEAELVADQGRSMAGRIATFRQTSKGEPNSDELHTEETLLAMFSGRIQAVLEDVNERLKRVQRAILEQDTSENKYRMVKASELKKGVSLLKELRQDGLTGIVTRRSRTGERMIIKVYEEGDEYDDEATANDLIVNGRSLMDRVFAGERILIREGQHRVPVAILAPPTAEVDAHIERLKRMT